MSLVSSHVRAILGLSAAVVISGTSFGQQVPVVAAAAPQGANTQGANLDEVIVTARYREESAQDVPIALAVIGKDQLEAIGASSIFTGSTLTPAVQIVSSNPRNTAINIRGFGNAFGLTNDGLEPGVGFYVDQVYNPRPGSATFEFVDIDRIEVLRGPQGTLFGKNTTAGAINISSRVPTFAPAAEIEGSGGTLGYTQVKGLLSGGLNSSDTLAGSLSFINTQRDGTLENVTSGKQDNEQDNLGFKGQLLFQPGDDFKLRLIADWNRQESNCCTQVYVRVAPTLRSAARQFPGMSAAAGYVPPSTNPYDRVSDVNSPIQANQKVGGAALIADWNVGGGTLTSVSSWRFWEWRPLNDRDYTSLSILTASANNSDQVQYSQELRFAGNLGESIDYIVGLYGFHQNIETNGLQGYGADAARWLIGGTTGTPPVVVPANLLDGYQSAFTADSNVYSYAVFGQLNWAISDRLTLTPGVRFTDDSKDAEYNQVVSGGPPMTGTPAQIAALTSTRNSIVRDQFYTADFSDSSASGQVTVSFALTPDSLLYGTYARGYKSGGINLAGLPADGAGNPILTAATVDPEQVQNYELGLKNQFFGSTLTLNLAAFFTTINDYQTTVQDNPGGLPAGTLRGYIANIDEVRNRGIEVDASWRPTDRFSAYLAGSINDGEYVSFKNAPCPLELTGGPASCDLSGRPLPALSDYSVSGGAEYRHSVAWGVLGDELYFGLDGSYRSEWYSDASLSEYSKINGYAIANVRAGLRSGDRWDASLWARNALGEKYLLFTSNQNGNSGLVIGQPGDPRTYGLTLRAKF